MAESLHHPHADESAHGNATGYVVGFVLSVLLTGISFVLGLHMGWPPRITMLWLGVLAFIQIVVHLFCFLHLSPRPGHRWNVLALGYTVLAALFLVIGTIWVMESVHQHMMSR